MSWILNISSTLKTWVFKKKLLKFSDRFRRDTQACFYCPEMCRFSCPTVEALRDDSITPRGKMSLLHLAERGFSAEKIAGSAEKREWFLEQCTGCGRCTEYCVYENDVASNLRVERAVYFEAMAKTSDAFNAGPFQALEGVVLLCEPGRKAWWEARPQLREQLGVQMVCEDPLPHREWGWGKLSASQIREVGQAFGGCKQIWVESPEVAWFLAQGVKEEHEALRAEIRVVWQRLAGELVRLEFSPEVSVHESFHLTRLFPRLGFSIPMYERGLMPFHSGWNCIDCGGEGFYQEAHPASARKLGERFLDDLVKDGRTVNRIVCQSLSCVGHLRGLTEAKVTYWLDEVAREP